MPELTIIAGCNGAGKSTFAKSFLPANETSFDYDRTFHEFYNSLPDSELRENFAQFGIYCKLTQFPNSEYTSLFLPNLNIHCKQWQLLE